MADDVAVRGTSLLELIQQELSIYREIQEAHGELTPELDQLLSNIQLDRADKIDSYQFLIEQFDFRVQAIRAKELELHEVRKKFEKVIEKLRTSIKTGMAALNVDELHGNDSRFKLVRLKKPRLVIQEDLLPKDYKTQIVHTIPDRERIQQDIDLGLEIAGVEQQPVIQLRSYVQTHVKRQLAERKKEGE